MSFACGLGFRFLVLDVAAQDAHLLIAVLLKVKAILLAEAQLEQVVVEGLLADAHFGGRVLQTVAHEIAFTVDAVV